jgi:predicted ATP-dependent endonuclease of OLD family
MENTDTPLLTKFNLIGLNGYKNLSIKFHNNAAIILSENGAGKTISLNVLHALLEGSFSRLRNINFIKAELYFGEECIIFNREHAFNFSLLSDEKELSKIAHARNLQLESNLSIDELLELLKIFSKEGRDNIKKNHLFNEICIKTSLSLEEIFDIFDKLNTQLYNREYNLKFQNEVKKFMGDIQVLYLPACRRIEATYGEINRTYFQLSNNIFDAVVKASEIEFKLEPKTNPDSFQIMFKCLGRDNTTIEKILSQDNLDGTLHIQRLFLQQLLQIHERIRPLEDKIEQFISVVNAYFYIASSDKRLRFDKIKLKVDIWNESINKTLPFEYLSSGERQIVSIFAKLMLEFGKKYIVMIDEPELSLSLEWQRKFLPDIFKTNSCRQLIATTHSPFIFENELDPFADSIKVSNYTC